MSCSPVGKFLAPPLVPAHTFTFFEEFASKVETLERLLYQSSKYDQEIIFLQWAAETLWYGVDFYIRGLWVRTRFHKRTTVHIGTLNRPSRFKRPHVVVAGKPSRSGPRGVRTVRLHKAPRH
ncbi:hypothetical protein AVEN_247131-1 [Araneus ventricosus]|uniref:Uncharacterized protein n=1 Tax=Araneus ventricosus TaxID=182803 RepID=A0A4Y2FQX4_ARAVE|nr:hypothetical protein AVEN_247131-1 [Araneus ventricosus]